jgi:coatomer protein complex subunit alpha (xenin)
VEYAYQKTKNFERLSFLYLITGNLEKLEKMLKIAEMRNDIMGRFHNALYLGDVQERVRILEESNHLPLAYATAKVHGLTEAAEDLEAKLLGENKSVPSLPEEGKSVLLMPPRPILQENNWPLLVVTKGLFEGAFAETVGSADMEEDDEAAGAWGAEMEIVEPEEGLNGDSVIVVDEEDRGEHFLNLAFLFVVWVYISV